jgi:phospholipase/carboxylesterase
MSPLDGPRLVPLSGTARQLIVLTHGYGADGNDLISLGQVWQQALPDAAFVAPHAPQRVPDGPAGFQWFTLNRMETTETEQGAAAALPGLDSFIDAELAATGVAPDKLILVGFSQGAMMALYAGLRRKVAPAAILAFSGLMPGRVPQPSPAGAYPPVFISHGDSDPVVPPQLMFVALGALQQVGAEVEWHLARNVPHGIDPESLELGGQFILKALANRP